MGKVIFFFSRDVSLDEGQRTDWNFRCLLQSRELVHGPKFFSR